MKVRIRHVLASFGWWQWALAIIFLLAVVLATLFAVRTVRRAIYWRLHHEEPIERWMTVNYVAHSYDLPPDVLWDALGLPAPRPPLRPDRRPLSEIATAKGQTFEQVKATLEAAITAARPPALVPPPGTAPAPPPAPPPRSEAPPRSDRGAP